MVEEVGTVSDHSLMVLAGIGGVVCLAWATVVAGRYRRVNLAVVALTIVALTAIILTAVTSKEQVTTLLGAVSATAVGALASSLIAAFNVKDDKPHDPAAPQGPDGVPEQAAQRTDTASLDGPEPLDADNAG